jgi:5-formyltetrahydrofolate cyclo-ligase
MLPSYELIRKYGRSNHAKSSGERKRASRDICRTLYDSYHASPDYVRSVFLAFYGPDTAPDIRDFAGEMSVHSDKVFFPVIAGNTLVFFEQGTDAGFAKNDCGIYEPLDITDPLEETAEKVLLIPYEVFSGQGNPKVTGCYKNFLASCPNLQRIQGIAFDSQIGAEVRKEALEIVPEIITTENRIIRIP